MISSFFNAHLARFIFKESLQMSDSGGGLFRKLTSGIRRWYSFGISGLAAPTDLEVYSAVPSYFQWIDKMLERKSAA